MSPSALVIRQRLKEAAKQRAAADESHAAATAKLVQHLRHAADADGITMSEAAKLAGVSRKTAYQMLRD